MSTQSPPSLRRQPAQARAQKSLENILQAAAELIGEQGTEGFSMAELARQSGLSKAALYRYFPNRQAIVLALAKNTFDQNWQMLVDSLSASPELAADAMQSAVAAYCDLNRQQHYRRHLRAAIHADPVLAALDLADSRRNAAQLSAVVAQRYPKLDAEQLEARVLLAMGCLDALANMTAQVDETEAQRLIAAFVDSFLRDLVGPE